MAGLVIFSIATPARASDMGILGPVFCLPVNLCAACLVAALGLPSSTRPSMAGNIAVGLIAVTVGVPGSLMAYVALTYVASGNYQDAALAYLGTFALLVGALAFTIGARGSRGCSRRL